MLLALKPFRQVTVSILLAKRLSESKREKNKKENEKKTIHQKAISVNLNK